MNNRTFTSESIDKEIPSIYRFIAESDCISESDTASFDKNKTPMLGIERAISRKLMTPSTLLYLQQIIGNQYVQRLVKQRSYTRSSMVQGSSDLIPVAIASQHGQSSFLNMLTETEVVPELQQTTSASLQREKMSANQIPIINPNPTKQQVERRHTAEAVLTAITKRGGINVAVYITIVVPKDKEFERQATQYARDHQSFGIHGNQLKQGVAMEIDKSVAQRLSQVVEAANALLEEFPDLYKSKPSVKVETLSIFTHGELDKLQAGRRKQFTRGKYRGKTVNEWIGPATLAAGIAQNLDWIATVNLFACSTAGRVKIGDNFATTAQKQLEADLHKVHGVASMVEIWGHSTARHATFNPDLVGISPDYLGNNVAGDLQQQLALRLLTMVLNDTKVIANDKTIKILAKKAAGVIKNTFENKSNIYVKDEKGKKKHKKIDRTNPKDPLNVYFREISALSIDAVWGDLISPSDPSDYNMLGLTEDAQARMVKGIKEFRARFQPLLTAFKDEVIQYRETKSQK